MNIKTVAHPSEILYDMVLEAPKDLLQISNYELFKDIILNKKDLTEQNCEFLAKVFQTSKEYWMNIQAQWDKANSILSANKPCPDMAKDLSHTESFLYVAETGSPAKVGIVPVANEFQSQNLYVISEQAYKYFLSKCTEDELWDLGFLGQSEKHVKKVEPSQTLQNKIKRYYGNGLETAR